MQKLSPKQRLAAVQAAKHKYECSGLAVYGDEENAISEADGGVWVQAWIWVDDVQIKEEARVLSRKQSA